MATFIDITDSENLFHLLSGLKADTLPSWGRLRAQSMVEHLIENVQATNGKIMATLAESPEDALREKQQKVLTDFIIPRNAGGFSPDATKTTKYKDLDTAIKQLMEELQDFHEYFGVEGRTAIHPGFGPMNYHEWIVWHGKHFTHHFRQFGLIE